MGGRWTNMRTLDLSFEMDYYWAKDSLEAGIKLD
jgi:hypothetical protein